MGSILLPKLGGFEKSSIIVTAPAGSTVSIASASGKKKFATERNGIWIFKNCDTGTWTVTASLGEDTAVRTVEIREENQMLRYYLTIRYRDYLIEDGYFDLAAYTVKRIQLTNSGTGETGKITITEDGDYLKRSQDADGKKVLWLRGELRGWTKVLIYGVTVPDGASKFCVEYVHIPAILSSHPPYFKLGDIQVTPEYSGTSIDNGVAELDISAVSAGTVMDFELRYWAAANGDNATVANAWFE